MIDSMGYSHKAASRPSGSVRGAWGRPNVWPHSLPSGDDGLQKRFSLQRYAFGLL